MKQIYFLIIIGLFTILPQTIKASHYMGGEITWECVNTWPDAGKYIFYMKVYRECGGITFGTSQMLHTTCPTGAISMSLVTGYPVDISPVCNSAYPQITCAGASSTGADNTGAVSEYLYKSNPITLNGIPPIDGWTFSWGTCCRNPSTNLVGQGGWKLRAKMYSYNGTNTNICLDNSPQFAKKARTVLTAGNTFSYTNAVYDSDLDSLHFEWGEPLVTLGNPVTYQTGYSYTNPLPDANINPNNIAATINSKTGNITLLSHTIGAFATSIKVSSYRNNQLIAEVWREIQLNILSGGINTPPTVALNINNNIVEDTVYAGNTISLPIYITDLGTHPNGINKQLFLDANGQQFGNYINTTGSGATYDSLVGCPNIPCATLSPAPSSTNPLSGTLGLQTQFNWKTNCNHLGTGVHGIPTYKNYYFHFEIWDDFCPVPAHSDFAYNITVSPKDNDILNTVIKSVSTLQNGDINIKWEPVIDSNSRSSFISYKLYQSDSYYGPYILIDTISNINIGSYIYNEGPNPTEKYFKIYTNQLFCNNIQNAKESNISSNMVLNTTNLDNCITKLYWNNTSSNNSHFIIKRKQNGIWSNIDTTSNIVYTDTCSLTYVDYMIEKFKVQISDSLGNISYTSSKSNIQHQEASLNIGVDTTICKDGDLLIQNNNGFDTYQWYNGISNNWLLIHASDFTFGNHNIWLKASMNYGCEVTDTLVLTIDDCYTSISENNINKLSFDIFPNPSSGKFTLDIKSVDTKDLLIEVISIEGKVIYSKKTSISSSETSINMDISSQAAGSYILRISNDNYKSQKVIKLI